MLSLRRAGRAAAAILAAAAALAGAALATPGRAAAAPAGPLASQPATAAAEPGSTLVKTEFPTEFAVPGELVHYTYTVTNTGNVTLHGVSVHDSQLGPVTCETDTLIPGEFTICEADYITTDADVASLFITSSATAAGHPPAGPPVTGTDTQVVDAIRKSGIEAHKTAFPARYAVAGEKITDTYTVTNVGDAPLAGVTVVDDKLGVIACPLIVLGPGASMTCTATYLTTQADVTAGRLVANGVIASGLPPSGPPVSGRATAFVKALQRPGIMVHETASPAGFGSAGQKIRYAYSVVNVGDARLKGIVITGSGTTAPVSCPAATLAPGAAMTCHASYVTTKADVRARGVASVAFIASRTANGTREVDRDMDIVPLIVIPVTG